jgi:hypothetical protein
LAPSINLVKNENAEPKENSQSFGRNQQQKDYVSNENSCFSLLQFRQFAKIQDLTKENQTLQKSSKQ